MSDPQPIEIEEAEVERLIDQAQQGQLDAADQKRIVPLLRTLLWLQRTLLETRISLAKLRKILFGKRTEKAPRKPKAPPDGSTDASGGSDDTSDSPSDLPGVESKEGTPSDTDHGEKTGSEEPAQGEVDVDKPTPRTGHGVSDQDI